MRLRHLIALAEVHRTGSVTAAAEALNFTSSALSQQLSRLEAELGVPVLERVGRGVRLTPAGLILVRRGDEIQDRLELARSEVAAASGEVSGTLRVASFQTLLLDVVPQVVVRLAQRHPALRVDLSHREVLNGIDGLRAHHFDVVLGEEFPGDPAPVVASTDRTTILQDPLRLAVPASEAPLLDGARLSDLSTRRWALDPERSPMGRWARTVCRSAGFEPDLGAEVTDPLLQAQLARSGLTPTFLPGLVGPEHLAGVGLLDLPGAPTRTLYSLARTGAAVSPAVLAFRAVLDEVLQEHRPAPVAGSLRREAPGA